MRSVCAGKNSLYGSTTAVAICGRARSRRTNVPEHTRDQSTVPPPHAWYTKEMPKASAFVRQSLMRSKTRLKRKRNVLHCWVPNTLLAQEQQRIPCGRCVHCRRRRSVLQDGVLVLRTPLAQAQCAPRRNNRSPCRWCSVCVPPYWRSPLSRDLLLGVQEPPVRASAHTIHNRGLKIDLNSTYSDCKWSSSTLASCDSLVSRTSA